MPRDVWEGPWAELENLALSGRASMSKEVFLELGNVDDECAPWAAALDGFVEELSGEQIEIATAITNTYPDWVSQGKNGADPFVIALAVEKNLVIVTDERRQGANPAHRNLKIPTVAEVYGVKCMNLVELARNEGWRF